MTTVNYLQEIYFILNKHLFIQALCRALSTLHILTHLILTTLCEVSIIYYPILPMGKLEYREVK